MDESNKAFQPSDVNAGILVKRAIKPLLQAIVPAKLRQKGWWIQLPLALSIDQTHSLYLLLNAITPSIIATLANHSSKAAIYEMLYQWNSKRCFEMPLVRVETQDSVCGGSSIRLRQRMKLFVRKNVRFNVLKKLKNSQFPSSMHLLSFSLSEDRSEGKSLSAKLSMMRKQAVFNSSYPLLFFNFVLSCRSNNFCHWYVEAISTTVADRELISDRTMKLLSMSILPGFQMDMVQAILHFRFRLCVKWSVACREVKWSYQRHPKYEHKLGLW